MSDNNTTENEANDQNSPEKVEDNAAGNQCEAPQNPQDVPETMTLMSPQQPPRNMEFDKFMMSQFRIKDCPEWIMQFYPHNPRLCPHVHPGHIQRRDPLCYTPEICPMIPNCEDYEECGFAHNIYQYCLHPRKFTRTRCYHGMNCTMHPCLFPHNSGQLFRDTAKPPPVRRPILPLPDEFRLPPPAPIQLLDAVRPTTPPRPLSPPPARRRRGLPPLPFPPRRNDDEASGSGTK